MLKLMVSYIQLNYYNVFTIANVCYVYSTLKNVNRVGL